MRKSSDTELERRERDHVDLVASEPVLDRTCERLERRAVVVDDPAVDDLQQPDERGVDHAVAERGLQPARLDAPRQPRDGAVAVPDDRGERPDHVRPRAQPRHEVLVRGLLALPRELIPGRPELLELLERARHLEAEAAARLRALAHVSEAGWNWNPTLTPRLRGSELVGGIMSDARNPDFDPHRRLRQGDAHDLLRPVLDDRVEPPLDPPELGVPVAVELHRPHRQGGVGRWCRAAVGRAAEGDEERAPPVRLEVRVRAPLRAPAVRVDLGDGVEQVPLPVRRVVEHHRPAVRRGGHGLGEPDPGVGDDVGSGEAREPAVGGDKARREGRTGTGRGAVEARDLVDRPVPELGEVLAVRVLDRLAQVGGRLPAVRPVDPVQRRGQVAGEAGRDMVDAHRERDLAREQPGESEHHRGGGDAAAAPEGDRQHRQREYAEQPEPKAVRRPVAVKVQDGGDRRAGCVVIGPAELDRLRQDEKQNEADRAGEQPPVDAPRLEDESRADQQQRADEDHRALFPERRERQREGRGLLGDVEPEERDRRRRPRGERAVGRIALPLGEVQRHDAADHRQQAKADRQREPGVEAQVDHPVLEVLRRHLPLVHVAEDDVVDHEQRSRG